MSKLSVKKKKRFLLPVVSLGAEFLVIGYLMRRNILAYKAPPNNEGYDIIAIHPDPTKRKKPIRIQVKSRYQTDAGWGFPVKEKSFESFDFLVSVRLNIGNFFHKKKKGQHSIIGRKEPEYYVFDRNYVINNHQIDGGWEKVITKGKKFEKEKILSKYKNDKGFEVIAKKLGVEYPTK